MKEQIQQVLDGIRPRLQADGGDVELVEVDEAEGAVKVRLTGACGSCPFATLTLKNGIEAVLKRQVPEVRRVEQVP